MNAKAEHKDDIFEDRKRVKNAIKTKEQSLENNLSLCNTTFQSIFQSFATSGVWR